MKRKTENSEPSIRRIANIFSPIGEFYQLKSRFFCPEKAHTVNQLNGGDARDGSEKSEEE